MYGDAVLERLERVCLRSGVGAIYTERGVILLVQGRELLVTGAGSARRPSGYLRIEVLEGERKGAYRTLSEEKMYEFVRRIGEKEEE